ncbi:MAG TPA: NfeD family protein [Acidimicrobiia bacterium]|nr:NfeD family protein [Acidimicrobiia bacterium]
MLRSTAGALIALGALTGGVALAQADQDPIVVIEVGGPMDQRLIDFVVGAIGSEDAHAFVLKVDSPGVSSGEIQELYDALVSAPAPIITWIGPSPAVAFGGSAYLANHSDIRSAAPGSSIGFLEPAVHRGSVAPVTTVPGPDPQAFDETVAELASNVVVVGESTSTLPGFVDRLDPALGQLIVSLDGATIHRGDVTFELSTARVEVIDGQDVLVPDRQVRFVGPGLLDRFLRLGASPETAFLFLVVGLAFAVFEFYAAGSGLMAFVASLALVVSGYGLATLPMRWPAVALVLGGIAVMVWGFVLNRVDWRAGLGVALLLTGGFTFTTTGPAYPPAWWMVIVATVAATVFIWYSLTTVVRARFATPTVGREELLGKRCLVVDTLDPLGVVAVDGARWRATADRGIEITAGAPGEIVGVTGLLLEIDPVVPRPRRSEDSAGNP